MNCLDTYALIEIFKGNQTFSFLLNDQFIIPDLTMAEFYGVLLREHGEGVAEFWLKKLVFYCKPASLEIMIAAVRFRQENRKKNFSFFDAIGYVFSLEQKSQFVTGDIEFKGMQKVRFVK